LLALVPISLILTLSFFVLYAARKVEEKGLKIFGYVVASLLWFSALLVFSGAVYRVAKTRGAVECMIQQKTKGCVLPQMRQQDNLTASPVSEKGAMTKDDKHGKCTANKGLF